MYYITYKNIMTQNNPANEKNLSVVSIQFSKYETNSNVYSLNKPYIQRINISLCKNVFC